MKKILTLLAIFMVAMTVNATRTVTNEWDLTTFENKFTKESPIIENLDDYIVLSCCSYTTGYDSGASNYSQMKNGAGWKSGDFDVLGIISIQPQTGAMLTSVELTFSDEEHSPSKYDPSITVPNGDVAISENKVFWSGSIIDGQFTLNFTCGDQYTSGNLILTKVKVTYTYIWELSEYTLDDNYGSTQFLKLSQGTQELVCVQAISGTGLNIGNNKDNKTLVDVDLTDPIYDADKKQYYVVDIAVKVISNTNCQTGINACPNLKSIILPNTLKAIGTGGLGSNSKLATITFEDGSQLNSLGDGAFSENTSLTSFELPQGITSLPQGVFQFDTKLKDLVLPSVITSVGNYAFMKCSSLGSLVFPPSLRTVGSYCFSGAVTSVGLTFKSVPRLNASFSAMEGLGYKAFSGDININLTDDSYVHTSTFTYGDYVPDNVKTANYTRTMEYQWGTVVLPYPVVYNSSNGSYKLYALSDASNSNLTFTEYENGTTIAAGTPMAIKAIGEKNAEGKYTVTIDAGNTSTIATSRDITATTAVDGLSMNGTYTNVTDKTSVYFIAQDKFWKADTAITIAPFRAWFEGTPAVGSAKSFNIVEGDEIDGINLTPALSQGEGVRKYLEGGKVVIVRNGKKYNINGQVLK